MASRIGMASRVTLALTQLAMAAALVACGGGGGSNDSGGSEQTVITAQPVEQSTTVNGTARFALQATGDGLKFQWQRSTNSGGTWSDVAGATQSVLEIFNVTLDQDGHLYRARVAGDGGTVTTTAVALRCSPAVVAPSITVNLASPAQITEGAGLTLAVTAAGTSLTYRWQTSPAGSTAWSTLSGNNSPQLLLNNVPLSDDGRHYRVNISNSTGSVTSLIATLSVKAAPVTPVAPTVTTQPLAVSVKAPNPASFTVAVSGNPTPAVQWQYSPTDSSNPSDWIDIRDANDLTYSTPSTTTALDGIYFRAKVSNSSGMVFSRSAKLTVSLVNVAPSISSQPMSQTATLGSRATFTVNVAGTPTPTVQWQVSTDGRSWSSINGATGLSFTTGYVSLADDGKLYRIKATNASGEEDSSAATLSIPSRTSFSLNDTGTVFAARNNSTNSAGCSTNVADWQPLISQQDCSNGYDSGAGGAKKGYGPAGFDLSKVSSNGTVWWDSSYAGEWLCILDNRTELIWLRSPGTGLTNHANGRVGSAKAYVDELNKSKICGRSDWRVPSLLEHMSISKATTYSNFFDQPSNGDYQMWLSHRSVISINSAWTDQYMDVGEINTHSVRPVAGTPVRQSGRFIVDATKDWVVDQLHGLIWRRCLAGQVWNGSQCTGSAASADWKNALKAGLDAGGSWRLPNINELASLIDPENYSTGSTFVDDRAFPGLGRRPVCVWSSTPSEGVDGSLEEYSRLVCVGAGQVTIASRDLSNQVLLVRDR